MSNSKKILALAHKWELSKYLWDEWMLNQLNIFIQILTGLGRKHKTHDYGVQPLPILQQPPRRDTDRILMMKHSCLIGQQLIRKHSTIPKFHQPHMLNSSLHVTKYISLSREDYGFYFPPTSPAQKLLLWGRTELWMRSQGLFIHNYFNDVVW